jgi:DNA-directed RNA polymerase specialized sigma24 family protein
MALDDDPSVSVWMQQMKAGDSDQAVQKLWERYFQRLVGLARVKLGKMPRRVADEEDVALSAFDSFCQGVAGGRFPQLDDRDNLWRILVTITARKVFKLNSKNMRQKRGGHLLVDLASQPMEESGSANFNLDQFLAKGPTPEFAAQAAEEFERLLSLLPSQEMRVIAKWKMEGYTNEEIAAQIGCVLRSVERRLRTIRACWEGQGEPGA